MLKVRLFGWLGLLVLASGLQAAEGALGIPLGSHRVHPTHILARYKQAQSPATLQSAQLLSNLGLAVRRQYSSVSGLVVLDTPRGGLARQAVAPANPDEQRQLLVSRIAALRRSGLFQYVEPDYVRYPLRDANDEKYTDGTLWGLRNDGGEGGVTGADISAREAWDLTIGSRDVIVAVIDTGIRYTHRELQNQMWRNPLEIPGNGIDDDGNGHVDDVFGINAEDPDAITGDPMDYDDHGTHVAGTIGAAANDGNQHVGVAWEVQLMACKFLGALGGYDEGAIACIEYAADNGATVLNNSWGGGGFGTALRDAIAMAQSRGIVFVAAAGNTPDNDNDVDPHYPSSYDLDNIIAVAALDRADRLASFSCFGLTSVDIGAPGVDIYSSISISDDAYDFFSGTSMAAPHVSGVAALIRAHYPGISLYELRERILQTAIAVPALDGITVTGGRVNAYKALSEVGDGNLEVSISPPNDSVLLPGSTQDVFAVVTDTFGITNATLDARFLTNGPALAFANDGAAPDRLSGDSTYSARFIVATNVSELTLEVVATAPDKNPVTNIVHWFVAAPPLNDFFANAFKIQPEGEVINSNSKYATFENPDEPLHAGVPTVDGTLWWTWSPPYDNRALVDTAGSQFDAVVAVYTGSSLVNLREVASANDVGAKKQPYVQFDATAGTTYYIVVGGATLGDRGSMRLRVEPGAEPDLLPPVVQFTSPASGITVTTDRLLVTGTAVDLNKGSGVAQVFVRLATDSVPRVATGTTNWSAQFLLRPGENRVLAWGADFARNVGDPISLTIYYLPETVLNDHFANAWILPGTEGEAPVDTRRATHEFGEPRHAGNQGARSVWYRWTAPADGVLTVATTNVTFDTLLAVYTGTAVAHLTPVAANDDASAGSQRSLLTAGVHSGGLYSIAVDGYAGGSGTNLLTYAFVPTALQELTVAADAGGRVKPDSGSFETGTTVTLTASADLGYAFSGWTVTGAAGSTTPTDNPLLLTMDADYAVRAHFTAAGFTDDFESGGFSGQLGYVFTPAGSTGRWSVQRGSAAGGQYAARSAQIAGNGSSRLRLVQSLAAGVASFSYRVSSEATWDKLEFFLNGELRGTWSGETGWATFQTAVPEGVNILEWRYSKDNSLSVGDDVARLDNITLPLASTAEQTRARLQVTSMPGALTLRLQGISGTSYLIERSDDLDQWSEVSTRVAVDGLIEIPISAASAGTGWFYRARQQ